MQKMLWMNEDTGQVASIKECIDLANRFLWGISIVHSKNGNIGVLTGDKAVFIADNMDAVEAFLYGMGLAYSVIPRHIAEQLGKGIGFGEEEMKEMGFN